MKARILIVEDESLFALELEMRLRRFDYDICGIVDNFHEAVELAEIHRPDLILMDIRIKGEVDGIATAEAIRKKNEIPVIFLTAYSDEDTIKKASHALPYGYLSKPVQAQDLHSTIETALYKSKAERELKKHEEQYRIIKSTDLFGYWIADESGKLLEVNDAYCVLSGYTREELLHLSIPDLEVIEKPEDVLRRVQKIIENGKDQFENKHKAKDGRVFDVEVSIAHWPSQKQFIVFIRDITDRKQAEKTIKNSERTYRLLYENNLAGVFTSTIEGVLINCNESFARILGYSSAKQLQGCNTRTLYFDPAARSDFIESISEKEYLDSYELCLKSASGDPVWVLAATTLIDRTILQGTIVNITERKNYENALRLSEQKYHRVVENIDEALIIDDVDGKVIFANSTFKKLFGITEEDLSQIHLEDYVAPEWRDTLRDRHNRRTLGEDVPSVFEYEGIRKDGTRIWLEVIVAKVIENDRIVGTQSAIRDITERKRSETHLRESEETFRRLFEESADPVLLLDETGFINCNQAALLILGYSSKEEFCVKQPWEVSPERQPDGMLSSEKIHTVIDLSISNGYHRFEWIHSKSDGSEFPVEVMLTPIRFKGKQIIYTVWRDITERKHAEQALRQSEGRNRSLLDAIPDMIFRLDPQGRYIDFKVESTTDLYVLPDQFIGKPFEEVLPEDLREKLRTTIASARSTGKLQTVEYDLSLPRGKHTFEARILVTREDEVVAVVRNITDRKKSEKLVKQLSSAIEQTADHIMITDTAGIIQYVNPSFTKVTGYSAEEVIGKKPNLLKSGKHDESFYVNLWKTILAGRTYRDILVNRKKNGNLFYEEKTISPIFDESGDIAQFISTGKDITENKKAEILLKNSEMKYRGLVDSSPDMIFLVKDGVITSMNSTFRSMLEYDYDNLRDRQLESIFIFDSNLDSIVKKLSLQSSSPVFVEGRCQTKSGKWLDVEIGFVMSDIVEGSIIHGTARNITEIKLLQERANQMQKLASLGEFSATTAHEIRNPLGAVSLNFEHLLKKTELPPKLLPVANSIRTGIQRIQNIIQGILSFARPQKPNLKRVDLCMIMDQSIKSIAHVALKKKVHLHWQRPKISIPVTVDSNQMIQVFINILTNGIQAASAGGNIEIRITEDDGPCIRISDNGPGIPTDKLDKIFEPFYTTKTDGMGLGLAVVKNIVNQHGGSITVKSIEGSGTTFIINLSGKGTGDDNP